MTKTFGSIRLSSLFVAALLLVALAVPASASAGFHDEFAASVASPEGTSGKDWIETFPTSLSSATKETGEPSHAGFAGGHSVWISWQFNEDTDARASACGAKGADLLIGVYTGSAVNALTEVDSESEENEAGCVVVRFDAEEGSTYRIAVDAKSSPGTTAMNFDMGRYPANDDFADAIVLPEFPTTVQVDPGFGGPEPGEPLRSGITPTNSVWYQWTAGKSGLVSINNCDNYPQLYATVFTGPALEELTEVGAPIVNGGNCDETRFEAEEGVTYSIRVEGSTGKGDKMAIDFEWVSKTLLSVTKSGSGSGTVTSEPAGIECGLVCEASFYRGVLDYGQILMKLTATPDPGSVFVGWSGEGWYGPKYPFDPEWEPGCGSEPVCEFSMFAAPAQVTAEFEELPPLLASESPSSGSDEPPASSVAQTAPGSPAQASQQPQGKRANCAKKKMKGKKGAKASKRRAACRR